MRKPDRSRVIAMVVTLAMSCSISVFANGFRNPPSGASALGMAGGKLTLIDDPAAVSVNPAHLLRVEDPSYMGSLSLARSRVKYTAPTGETAKTRDSLKWLPNLHAAWPLQDEDWVVGLGLTTPFGQSTEWSKESPFRYTAPYFAELMVLDLNPSVATRINDRITVGAGVSFIYSEVDFRSIVPWSAGLGMGMNRAMDGRVRFDGDGHAFGANAGAALRLTERQQIAATYRSAFNVDYDGTTRADNIPQPLQTAVAPKSNFESTIRFPAIVAAGYGVEVTEKIRLGLDVEWIEFSRYDNLPVDAGVNNAAGLGQEIPQDWKDTWTFGIAGDWAPTPPWTLRAGYLFMESPIPTRTVAPSLPDADRHLFTLGVSYAWTAHAVDLAYAYSLFDDLEVRDNNQPAYHGDYDLSSHLFQISYRREF